MLQKRILFDANSANPFFRCHIYGASNIALVKSNILGSQVVKMSTSSHPTYLEFIYEKICSRILYRFLIFRIFLLSEHDFKFELKFSSNDKKPFILSFSTKFQSLSTKKSCVMVPLFSVLKSMWLNLTIDMFSFLHDLKIDATLRKLQSITVYPFCFLSEISVTSGTITDSPFHKNSRNLESKTSIIYQVLNVQKIRLSEWRQTELINIQSSENFNDFKKGSNSNTTGNHQSPVKVSCPSSLEVDKRTLEKQRTGKQPVSLQIKKICINEQSSPTIKKTSTELNVSKDPRSFSAGAVVNRSNIGCNNNYSTNLFYYPEEDDKSSQSKSVIHTKSENDGQKLITETKFQSIGLGNLYLFNSLPQPAPNLFTTTYTKEVEAEAVGMEDSEDPVCSESSHLRRISIDQHSLRELSEADLKFKVFMASASHHEKCNSTLHKDYYLHGSNENPLHINNSNEYLLNDRNIKEVNELDPPPIDLAGYERSDDLSASFEASLLASLKQAAMGGNLESDLLFMKQELTRQKSGETGTASSATDNKDFGPPYNKIRKRILNSTESEQCDILNAIRRQILNVSFSDHDDYDEGEDATTSDGLGSLIYLRYHLAHHHGVCHQPPHWRQQQQEPDERFGGHSPLSVNHQVLPTSETSAFRQANYICSNGKDGTMCNPSPTSSMINQRIHSTEDISQLITGVELSSHWGTGTSNSSNESLSYATSGFPYEPNQFKQQTNLQETPCNTKEQQLIHSTTTPDINSSGQLIELIYDPVLNCYYDPKLGRFYELI
ncbi:unnamed protein product [Heterobilharzia americana]|nr:unnamed protein product [Heterobilharzia americana]